MTNRPVGLMWYFVFSSSSSAGSTAWITCFRMSARSSSLPTVSACCVEMTTASMRTGLPFASYSTVTWLLPSGRRYGSLPFLRTSVSRCGQPVRQRDRRRHQLRRLVGRVAEHHALVARAARVHALAMSPDCLLIVEITAQVFESNHRARCHSRWRRPRRAPASENRHTPWS